MLPLRQSTTATIRVGPILSPSDGLTPVTGLSAPASSKVYASKNGTAAAYTVASWAETGNGLYTMALSTTDTNTAGRLVFDFADAVNYVPFFHEFNVLSQTGFDALYANSGAGIPASLAAGSITPATFSLDALALLARGYFATTGTTTGPVAADPEWAPAGFYTTTTGTIAAIPYYVGKTTGLYAWTDGTFWYITSTAPGVSLPAGYFKSTGSSVVGPYTNQGTATGTPVVAYHGNAVANAFQPNKVPVTLNATDVTGNVAADLQTIKTQTVTCGAGVAVLASVGTATTNTAQTGDAFARLGANGAGLTAIGDTRLANLDVAVSTRSTYAGADTSGTTTLLSRIGTPTGASIAADIGTRLASTAYTAPPSVAAIGAGVDTVLTGSHGAGAWGGGGSSYTPAQIATAVWQDATAGDFTTTGSIGKSLAGAFTALGASIFTTGSLANAPTGGGGGASLASIQGELDTRGLTLAVTNRIDVAVSTRLAGSAYASPPTVGAIATAVWQDTTAGDFTVTGSIGKSLGGSFTALGTSVFSTGSLANAPTGSGGSGALPSNGLDSIVIETGVNARQALSAILAASAGSVSGAGTGTIVIKGAGVSTTRINATTDNAGNRSTVTLTLPT